MTFTRGVASGRYRSRTAGVLIAGGVLGAVAASALATSVAPVPARAFDGCVSSALGTFQSGSASCSGGGFPLTLAIAIGANSVATTGGLFNLSVALGANSYADTTPTASGGSANLAWAIFGATAESTNGNFNLARALGDGAQAIAGGSAGAAGDPVGSFNIARAFGPGAVAAAMNGNLCRCGTYIRIKEAIHAAADVIAKGGAA